jgi:hypothetical protein
MSINEDDFGPKGGSFAIPPSNDPVPEAEREEVNEADGRLPLVLDKGSLHRSGDTALMRVAKHRPPVVYSWGGVLAQIVHVPDVQRPNDVPPLPRVHLLDHNSLSELFNRHVAFQRLVRKGQSEEFESKPADCPLQLARWVQSRGQWADVAPLAGIRESPALLPSGRLIETAGYDSASGLFLDFAQQFPPVPRARRRTKQRRR